MREHADAWQKKDAGYRANPKIWTPKVCIFMLHLLRRRTIKLLILRIHPSHTAKILWVKSSQNEDFLVDRFSERKEIAQKGRLLTQAEYLDQSGFRWEMHDGPVCQKLVYEVWRVPVLQDKFNFWLILAVAIWICIYLRQKIWGVYLRFSRTFCWVCCLLCTAR